MEAGREREGRMQLGAANTATFLTFPLHNVCGKKPALLYCVVAGLQWERIHYYAADQSSCRELGLGLEQVARDSFPPCRLHLVEWSLTARPSLNRPTRSVPHPALSPQSEQSKCGTRECLPPLSNLLSSQFQVTRTCTILNSEFPFRDPSPPPCWPPYRHTTRATRR